MARTSPAGRSQAWHLRRRRDPSERERDFAPPSRRWKTQTVPLRTKNETVYSSNLCNATKPVPAIPSARALPRDKLSTDVRVDGPRSLMRTTTDRPFAWFTTRSRIYSGSGLHGIGCSDSRCRGLALREARHDGTGVAGFARADRALG